MPELSKDTTPEEVYELLQSLERDGMLRYILPTEPLGESWVLGVDEEGPHPDVPGSQLLKLNHEQVIAFLIGNQMTLHWLMGRLREQRSLITLSKADAETIVKLMDECCKDRWNNDPMGPEAAGLLGLRHRLAADAQESLL